MIIRPATEQDVPAVRQVLVTSWHQTYDGIFGAAKVSEITDTWHSSERLSAQLAQADAAFMVAERNGDIVGTVFATPEGKQAIMLQRLYLLPEAQGQGIGRALFDAALARFPNAKLVQLEVEPRNTRAIAFYERLGFVARGGGNACGGDQAAALSHLNMEKTLGTIG